MRRLRIDGREVIRGVYGAVRDANWGTIQPSYSGHEVEQRPDGFRVSYEANHRHAEIDFTWRCTIEAEGPQLHYVMDGRANRSFRTNRIGLCVLHPDDVAGTPVIVETLYGILRGRFPDQIAPVSCFTNIRGLRQRLPGGGRLSIDFVGDLFEMEDQRNWTDASFKTFSRPLALPAPWRIEAGEVVRQEIIVSVEASGMLPAKRPALIDVSVGLRDKGPLPALGVASSSVDARAATEMLSRVRSLGLSHLRLFMATSDSRKNDDFEAQLTEARHLQIPVELEVAMVADGQALAEALDRIREAGLAVARLLVFDRQTFVTSAKLLATARRVSRRAGLRAPIGGGSRADFYELNQAGLPSAIDIVAFRMTPQIHAVDDASIMESIRGQIAEVRSARAMAGEIPIAIGPVTLQQLFNPAASDPAAMLMSTQEPPDPRQAMPFAAAWTLASIAALSDCLVATITYHRTAGPCGLQPGPDEIASHAKAPPVVHPVYHVLADVASVAHGRRLGVTVRPGLAALAIRTPGQIRLLVANLEATTRRLLIRLPAGMDTGLWLLDDDHVRLATVDPVAFRSAPAKLTDDVVVPVLIRPYGVARIDRAVKR